MAVYEVMEKYILNKNFEETQLGKDEGTVFYDPETENTHVLDEVALAIIDLFRKEMTIDDVIAALMEAYAAPRETIELVLYLLR